ncbi:MAG: hypothetical protein ACI9DF_002427 [Verrucomicrobiales bacterium]|jgi:hypothetical protein
MRNFLFPHVIAPELQMGAKDHAWEHDLQLVGLRVGKYAAWGCNPSGRIHDHTEDSSLRRGWACLA